jgi:hypothetical protein
MAEPIVFITTLQIHEGRLAELKAAVQQAVEFQEHNGPQLMMGVYIDEEQMQANGVQVHRDSDSILAGWQVADPYMREVMQYVTTTRVDIYGQPSEPVIEGMRRLAGGGATVSIKPRLAGFSRLPTG